MYIVVLQDTKEKARLTDQALCRSVGGETGTHSQSIPAGGMLVLREIVQGAWTTLGEVNARLPCVNYRLKRLTGFCNTTHLKMSKTMRDNRMGLEFRRVKNLSELQV